MAPLPRLHRVGPPVLLALVCVIVLLVTGVGLADQLRYALATVWGVLLPGVALRRVVIGRARSLLDELTVGFVLGLGFQLVAWAVCVGLGVASALLAAPAVLLVGLWSRPGLRARLRPAPYVDHLGAARAWTLAVITGVAVLPVGAMGGALPLPPATDGWMIDMYWHLAITSGATHQAPPEVPQVAGELLRYHWFANAHMAADTVVSGVDVWLVVSRLWFVPMILASVGAVQVLTSRLTRHRWAGVSALLLLLVSPSIGTLPVIGQVATQWLSLVSPSGTFAVPILLVLIWQLVPLVRRQGPLPRGQWVLLVALMVLAAGSKSSSLPVLLAGLVLAAALGALMRRPVRRLLLLAAATVAVVVVTKPFLAGGSNGSGLGMGTTQRMSAHEQLTTWELTHLTSPLAGTAAFSLLALVALVIQKSTMLTALVAPRELRREPASHLLLGITLGGLAAGAFINHPAMSQLYFLQGALPALAVVTAWATHACWSCWVTREQPDAAAAVLVVGVPVLVAAALPSIFTALAKDNDSEGKVVALWIAVLVFLAILVPLVLLARRRDDLGPRAAMALCAFLVGSAVATGMSSVGGLAERSVPPHFPTLTAGEVSAARWLHEHSSVEDVLATNVHCRLPREPGRCDSRAFWLTGLSGRQALVEGWGYTDQAQAKHMQDGLPYSEQPFHDPELLRRNDALFTQPTQEGLDWAWQKGVRWLVADERAGAVSPALRQLADTALDEGGVTVYRLRPPG